MQTRHQSRKRFGQNFLVDNSTIQRIINAIELTPQDHLVEIGPGQGALTQHLVNACTELDLIEIDRDLITQLKNKFVTPAHPTLRFHEANVLKFDFNVLAQPNHKLRILGNLPYNISTPLLFHLFNFCEQIEDLHLMLQYEVAHRILAKPGTKTYGRLSIMMQYYCNTTLLFNIDPHSFNPIPKVNSTFIRLIPRPKEERCANNPILLSTLVRDAFNQRRKFISNVLKAYLTVEDFIQLNLDPHARPEQFTPEDYVRLSNFVSQRND